MLRGVRSLDQAEVLSEQLAELELKLESLKTLSSVNKLPESQNLSVEAEALAKCASTAWSTLQQEALEAQQFTNALHGLSLMVGERRQAKLEELKARYAGTEVAGLLVRLFG
jgi:serine/threonine protein phosphatase 1